jgi:hypothetical protein
MDMMAMTPSACWRRQVHEHGEATHENADDNTIIARQMEGVV